jgi:hypothetical protein
MSTPLRDLDKYGVITDRDPYNLPPSAFSFASNVRFGSGKVESGPVFRSVSASLAQSEPRFAGSNNPTSGVNQVFIGYKNGRIYRYSGSETNYSIAGYVDNTVEATWSETNLADVYYVNREDHVPWYITSSASLFTALASGWDSTWRCRLLRACGGALVALNVTKGATNYPTMVKTSAIPTSGTVPSSWDHTTPSTNATENILSEMKSPIIDADPLGSSLFIYGTKEGWEMIPDGSFDVFKTYKRFDKGAINANCSKEVNGKAYVFGPDDIWAHDGVSAVSICEERVKRFIFDNLDTARSNQCFVEYFPALNELRFHYVSGDGYVAFPSVSSGCNRCAVFSLTNNTWTFDDLPLVYDACEGLLSATSLTYASVVGTYETFGGTYASLETTSARKSFLYVGVENATFSLAASLYAFDRYGAGSTASFSVDENATADRLLERQGIDLDELEADLEGYKTISSAYPQGRVDEGAASLQFAFGSSDYFGTDAVFGDYQTYDNTENYKVDPNVAGRWLAMRVLHEDYRNFKLSGIDFDIVLDR